MVPLLTQLLLQGLDERVLALLAEGTSEIIQVQGPDHGPSQSLLFQIADLGGDEQIRAVKVFPTDCYRFSHHRESALQLPEISGASFVFISSLLCHLQDS